MKQKHTHVYSQLQNEHHLSSALEHIFERDDVGVLDSVQDVHLLLQPAPVQAQAAARVLADLQEFTCPVSPGGPLMDLSNLSKMPTGRGKDTVQGKHQASED